MKTPLPDPQLIEIRANWTPADIYCLACGAEVMSGSTESSSPCEHLLFLHLTELGYTYLAPRIEDALEQAVDDMLLPTDDEFLALCPPATLSLRFNHSEVFSDGLSIIVGLEMPVVQRDPTD